VDSKAAREVLIQVAQRAQKTNGEGKYLDELLEDAVNAAADDAVDDNFKEKSVSFWITPCRSSRSSGVRHWAKWAGYERSNQI
jgi:hypothetical protein